MKKNSLFHNEFTSFLLFSLHCHRQVFLLPESFHWNTKLSYFRALPLIALVGLCSEAESRRRYLIVLTFCCLLADTANSNWNLVLKDQIHLALFFYKMLNLLLAYLHFHCNLYEIRSLELFLFLVIFMAMLIKLIVC